MTDKPKADQPSIEAYTCAAWMLGCDVAAIRAVAEVESGPQGAFLDSGEPVILYEGHVFHRLTGGRFDARYPDLSFPKWKPGAYGTVSEQHLKLQRAAVLDRESALKACSWGLFQVLGSNHRAAGYPTVQRMVTAAYRSVDDHLRMFVNFIQSKGELIDALRAHDWPAFAAAYNGNGYRQNKYDEKMAAAYKRLS